MGAEKTDEKIKIIMYAIGNEPVGEFNNQRINQLIKPNSIPTTEPFKTLTLKLSDFKPISGKENHPNFFR